MKNRILLPFFAFALLIGCKSQFSENNNQRPDYRQEIPPREYSIAAVLWQQHSGEYRALAYQAFNLAKMQLDIELAKDRTGTLPLAIVTDVDETILDNSPYSGKQIEMQEDYVPERWSDWVEQKSAKAIPGALEFFKYAADRGVTVFYVSNRTHDQEGATIENLVSEGFPYADESHLFLKTDTSHKGPRRDVIKETHEIIMLIGDNLSDFSSVFEDKSTIDRNRAVDSLRHYFGNRFIILPNAIYGDWETQGILEGRHDWNAFQKDSIRHKKVISY